MGWAQEMRDALAGAQIGMSVVNAYNQGREWQKEDDFNEAISTANKAYNDGVTGLKDSGLTDAEIQQRTSALDVARNDAMRNAYVQRYGDASKWSNYQAALQNENATARDNMALKAQQEAFNEETNRENLSKLMVNGFFSKDTETQKGMLEDVNGYLANELNGARIDVQGNNTFVLRGADGSVTPIDQKQSTQYAQMILNDAAYVDRMLRRAGIAYGNQTEYNKNEENKSDRATEAAKRVNTDADTELKKQTTQYREAKTEEQRIVNHAAKTGGYNNLETEDKTGKVIGAHNDDGLSVDPELDDETNAKRAEILEAGMQKVASMLKGKGSYKADAVGYDSKTGKWRGKVTFGGKTFIGTPDELSVGIQKFLDSQTTQAIPATTNNSKPKPVSSKPSSASSGDKKGSGIAPIRHLASRISEGMKSAEERRKEAAAKRKIGAIDLGKDNDN